MVGANPFAVPGVEVMGRPDAVFHGCAPHRLHDGPFGALWAHAQLAAHRMKRIGAKCKVFVLLEIGKHRIPAPPREPELAPVVEIGGLAADLKSSR